MVGLGEGGRKAQNSPKLLLSAGDWGRRVRGKLTDDVSSDDVSFATFQDYSSGLSFLCPA